MVLLKKQKPGHNQKAILWHIRYLLLLCLTMFLSCSLCFVSAFASEIEEDCNKEDISVAEYLDKFCEETNNAFIQPSADGFVYVAGDGAFLSEQEWAALSKDLSRPITRDEVTLLESRYEQQGEYIQNFGRTKTYESFLDTIRRFYPEYIALVEERKGSTEYWLNSLFIDSFSMEDVPIFLHELQHESAAIRSGQFQSRAIENNANYTILWKAMPSTFWYYDSKTKEWVDIEVIKGLPATRSLVKPDSPVIASSDYYKIYYNNDREAANRWGVYGILTELSSSVIELRVNAISISAGRAARQVSPRIHRPKKMPYCASERYYLWRASLLAYLHELETHSPQAYKRLMEDQDFLSLSLNLIDFGEEQLYYEDFDADIEKWLTRYSSINTYCCEIIDAFRKWSFQYDELLDSMRNQLQKVSNQENNEICA